jgi:dTDP-4-dehydrorhamnose 3,5-epimerase
VRTTVLGLGVLLLESLGRHDDRGSFLKVYDVDELGAVGVDLQVRQCALSVNDRSGTLRGLHLQARPHAEAKIVACTRGRAFDVVADVDPSSSTYGCWTSVELTGDDDRAVVVPAGLAHGFLTLEDDTQLLYLLSGHHAPGHEIGVRWDDPTLAVAWPATPSVISERDASLPTLPA